MKPNLPFAVVFLAVCGCFFELILASLEDYDLSAIKLIEKNGYPAEAHVVETEDGYFLQMQRIPHGKKSDGTKSRQPLLLSHGLLSSSSSFLMLGPHSLPFVAADRGYDVWLGNFRGTQYANLHRNMSYRSSEFWNFSFHEVGLYDLPAQIDYICNHTQRDNVTLVGYSYGSTVQLVMATTRPDYQKKVRAAVLIGTPSVFIRQKKFFQILSPLYSLTYSRSFTNNRVFGGGLAVERLMRLMGIFAQKDTRIYENLRSLTQKPDFEKAIKVAWFLLRFGQSATSLKVLMHYYQNGVTGKFLQYDYGPDENLKRYNSTEPPEYDLESITIPMGLIFTSNDYLAGKPSEDYLLHRMKNIKKVLNLKVKSFHHLNFIFGLGTTEMVYDKVVDFVEVLEKFY